MTPRKIAVTAGQQTPGTHVACLREAFSLKEIEILEWPDGTLVFEPKKLIQALMAGVERIRELLSPKPQVSQKREALTWIMPGRCLKPITIKRKRRC